MRFTNVFLSSLALVAMDVSALGIAKRSSLAALLPRQTSCDSICAPFQDTLSSCQTTACVCTAAVANSLQVCINCSVAASPTAAVIDAAQGLVDTYDETCTGITIPTVTVAGSSSASSISVSVPSQSTTAVGSSPSITISTQIPFPSTISQIVVRPSTTSTSPGTSSTGTTPGGLVNAASRDGAAKAVVIAIGAALGMVLVV